MDHFCADTVADYDELDCVAPLWLVLTDFGIKKHALCRSNSEETYLPYSGLHFFLSPPPNLRMLRQCSPMEKRAPSVYRLRISLMVPIPKFDKG
jgi:hypothetical protein